MPDKSFDTLLNIHIAQLDDIKILFQRYDARLSVMEQKIIELQIKNAESGTKMAVIWSIFTTFFCAIVGLAVGFFKK